VISLIGYFDLDPNRALDIILDVLSVHLATHYSFFLALLSFSPWSGVYKPPNRSSMTFDPVPNQYRDKSLDEVLLLAEAQQGNEHGSSPISHATTNPRVMAQVLGFKFGYYQVSDQSSQSKA
jgi:THO complex subunit 2